MRAPGNAGLNAGVQLLDLCEAEVSDKPAPHRRGAWRIFGEPRGEYVFDVGGALQRQVVDADEHAILRNRQVLLDEIGALLDRQPIGIERVLRRVRGGAPVRYQLFLHRAGASAAGHGAVDHPDDNDDKQAAGGVRE
jgi:hypothetical protein